MAYEGCSLVTVLTELFWPHLNCFWLPNEKAIVDIFCVFVIIWPTNRLNRQVLIHLNWQPLTGDGRHNAKYCRFLFSRSCTTINVMNMGHLLSTYRLIHVPGGFFVHVWAGMCVKQKCVLLGTIMASKSSLIWKISMTLLNSLAGLISLWHFWLGMTYRMKSCSIDVKSWDTMDRCMWTSSIDIYSRIVGLWPNLVHSSSR